MLEKAYKFRFYPTPEQESLLRRTIGYVRLIYNKALAARTQAWYEHSSTSELQANFSYPDFLEKTGRFRFPYFSN